MVRRFPAIHHEQALRRDYDQDTPIGIERPFHEVVFHPDRLDKPLHWRKPRRIGVCFTGDLFDEQARGSWLYSIYPVMVEADWHTYFVLTKQVKRMAQWISDTKNAWKNRTSHIWHGVSICDQEDADRMIPELLRIPGKKWLSCEPLLGPIGLRVKWLKGINFVIIGCESGPRRRPCKMEWVAHIVAQGKEAEIKIWVKQIDLNGKVCHDINLFPKELHPTCG